MTMSAAGSTPAPVHTCTATMLEVSTNRSTTIDSSLHPGLMVKGLGSSVLGSGLGVQGAGLRVQG